MIMLDLIGRFHPLLLHLPIGVLVYAFLHWMYEQFLSKKEAKTDFTFAFSIGAVSAVGSAISGWLLAKEGGFEGELLDWHKYLGIGTALGAIFLFGAYKKQMKRNVFAIFFSAFMLLLSATGHYGGSLTHGEGFLTPRANNANAPIIENTAEAHIFEDIVMPIFVEKCISCHNPQKSKGDLLLHDLAGWQKGGENGPALVAGTAAESAIVQRVFLPKEDEEHMPPSGKLQLTNEERDFLEWWVDNMTDYDHQIKDLETTVEVEAYLKSLQEKQQPDVNRPTPQQLADLTEKGFVANLQSSDGPWVDISLAQADSFEIENLSQLKKIAAAIKTIDLSYSRITDKEVGVLNRLEYVESINLSHCNISAAAIEEIQELPNLKILNFYGSQVDATVFPLLAKMHGLEKVYVWNTPITDRDIDEWQLKFPDLDIVRGVDYSLFGSPTLMAPIISAAKDLFIDSLLVGFDVKAARATIKYTLDGSNPTVASTTYTDSFYVKQTTEVKSILVMDGWTNSPVTSRTFAKSRYPIVDLQMSIPANEKYPAQGSKTLIDLKKGTDSFGDGNWLGFFGEDVRLTADLGEVQEISGVTIGTLSDFRSYIHLPRSIQVLVSTDGRKYVPYQDKEFAPIDGPSDAKVHNHFLRAAPRQARYIRIEIRNQKVNPESHPTPGATCWLFMDEILVE